MEQRACPHCRRGMAYRLGEWECPTCGTTLPGAHSHIKDQLERHLSQQSSSLPQYAAPAAPPPPRDVPGVLQADYDEHGRYQPRYAMSDEKGWLFWTAVVVNALPVLFVIGILVWIGNMMQGAGGMGGSGLGAMIGLILLMTLVLAAWSAIELWVLWQLLHSHESWLRYGCGCGTLLRLLSAAAGLFGVGQQKDLQELASLGAWAYPLYLLLSILYLSYNAWLLSVIYRDLRNLGRL